MSRTYKVNEIFASIQGEGARVGTPTVFVRFAGCNLRCKRDTHGFDCDTEFESGRMMTADEIVDEVARHGLNDVTFTGGEPMLSLDCELALLLLQRGRVAVETNGTRSVEDLPVAVYVACSPKVAEHALRIEIADELRYVRGHGQAIPRPHVQVRTGRGLFVSPAFDGLRLDPAAVTWCIQLVKENPEWRLSMPMHKWLGIR